MKKTCLALLFSLVLLILSPVQAQAQMSASGVLGQLDTNGDPSFNQGGPNGRPAINAFGFQEEINGIDLDTIRHRLYISDRNNNRVLVWQLENDNSIDPTQPADFVIGQTSFTTNTIGTTNTTLDSPLGLTVDETNGRLFVSDVNNRRVLVYDVSGAISNGMAATNVLGQADFTSVVDYGPTQNALSLPMDAAYDPDTNYLYVADWSRARVMVYDVAAITDNENAVHVLGQSDFSSTNQAVTQNGMYSAYGVSVDSANNRLFVADYGGQRVLVFDTTSVVDGENAVNVLGQADFTSSNTGVDQATLFNPHKVDYNPTRNELAVSDSGHNRVLLFDVSSITDGENATYVLGKPDFTTAGFAFSKSSLNDSIAVEYLGANYLAVGDISRVAIFDLTTVSNGEDLSTAYGQTAADGTVVTDLSAISPNANIPSPVSFRDPYGIAIDEVHNKMYVGDDTNFRVLVFELDPVTKDLVDGVADYVLGSSSFYARGDAVTGPTSASTVIPTYLAIDTDNQRLFVSDNEADRVMIFDVSTITNNEPAQYILGQPDATSNGTGATATTMYYPNGLAFDSTNQWLFVADSSNGRILVFDLSGGISTGMAAVKVIGQPDLTSNSYCNAPTADTFCDVEGELVFDEVTRRLYVTDPYYYRTLVFQIPSTLGSFTNGMSASYVIGQPDFTSSTYNPASAKDTDNMYGLELGDSSDLYMFDCYYNRVLLFDVTSLANYPSAVGVIGQSNFTGSSAGTSQTGLTCSYQAAVAINLTARKLYVADDGNHRILTFNLPKVTTTSLATGTVSTAYTQNLQSTQTTGSTSFSLLSGSLPTGLSLGASSITGTPTAAGSSNLSLRLSDDVGSFGTFFTNYSYSLTVNAATTPQASSGSSSSSGGGFSAALPATCGSSSPYGNPDLFQINREGSQAKLFFTPVRDYTTGYHVVYGYKEGDERFGGLSMPVTREDNNGVKSLTVDNLDPKKTYWFKVLPTNGCATGTWSNWLKAGKKNRFSEIFYRYF